MAAEIFANQPKTTVSAGGTTAPASGTQETWTVASSASFPAASPAASPPAQFHVTDPQLASEIIAVTNVSGTTWTVTRGAEGTTPVAHTAGFTVFQVATAGFLNSLPSRASVTVSPYGIANSKSTITNNGAQYGPDTAGTVTSGIQEAVNYAVTQALAGATCDVVLLPGKFTLSTFTNTTYRAAVTIDSGYAASAGPAISVTIRGTGYTMNAPEGTGFGNAFSLGPTVIDASALDSLAQGLYKQGRVFLVVPQLTSGTGFGSSHPLNAVQLRMENMVIILPTYNAAGTGSPSYTLSGVSSALYVNGDSQNSNTAHWQFVNGIDAWAASSVKVKNVSVISALAAYNPNGNQYAGGGGVFAHGSSAGIVFPEQANQGNNYFETISAYDLQIGIQTAAHVAGDQFYSQACHKVIYTHEGGHGARFGRLNPQSQSTFIQHLLLPQLTNSLASSFYDPTGDLYAPIGLSFPSSAAASSLSIGEASMESALNTFLVDDSSNPLTVVANVDYTGSITAGKWGSGKNLIINFIDIAGNSQTVLSGTTAGTVTYSQSGPTPWDKRFTAYLNGYENTTGTHQTITFVIAYNNSPAVMKDDTSAATVNATTLTLPASMVAPVTGYIILGGY